MKANIKNLVNENRNKLQDVIPLNAPYTISIDPSNLCNFKCKFCAIHYSSKNQKYVKQFMPIDIFKKAIDDMRLFPSKLKILRLSGMGEPLLNPLFPQMVDYAKKAAVSECIETFTNGSLLSPRLNRDIIDAGIDRIRISIEAIDDEGYYNISGVKVDFKSIVENIQDLYANKKECLIYIKTVDAAVPTQNHIDKFFDIFGDSCDQIFIDKVIPMWPDFHVKQVGFTENEKNGVHGQAVVPVKVCPFIFYQCIINSDGQVTTCCSDWERKLVIGDIVKDSLMKIWNGDVLRKFWLDMLSGSKNDYEMCNKCLFPMYNCTDNIDQYREDILKKMSFPNDR